MHTNVWVVTGILDEGAVKLRIPSSSIATSSRPRENYSLLQAGTADLLKTVAVLFRRPHSTGAEPSVGTGDPSLAERDRGNQRPHSWLLFLLTESSIHAFELAYALC